MPKHAVPAGPEGDAIRKRLRRQRLARTREWLVLSYLSLACGWLTVAVPCAVVGERMGQQTGWRSNALGMTMFLCGAMALVMLGRAVTWGRVRPYFWLHPPAGVGADRPSAVPDAPDQAQA